MNTEQVGVVLKRFESPDEVRILPKGKFELVRLGGMTIGGATYEPRWKWSDMSGRKWVQDDAKSSTSAWSFPEPRQPRWTTAGFLNYAPVSFFTFRPCQTTAGSSATSPTFRSIFSGRITMPKRPAKR